MQSVTGKKRYEFLDSVRGFLLLEMIVYHFFWDLTNLFGVELAWFQSATGYWWQQSVCWLFIFLSGFCWQLGTRPLRRGLLVLAGGVLVMAVTHVFVPQQAVIFGILFFLGSSMLLLRLAEPQARRLTPGQGLLLSGLLFVVTRNINEGYLGFEQWQLLQLPTWLYQNILTTYIGFTENDFYSSDYFSLLPWLPLFLAGYYACSWCRQRGALPRFLTRGSDSLSWCGRRSLLIYLLHQPVLYVILQLVLRRWG